MRPSPSPARPESARPQSAPESDRLAAAAAGLAAADPTLGRLIGRVGPERLGDLRRGRPREPFAVLVGTIIGQQVSVASARAILARLEARYGGRIPSPAQLLADDADAVRESVGLTRAKTAALRALAAAAQDGAFDLEHLEALDDAAVSARVTAVRGLGPWSAEIFLILGLQRADVVAATDLGIRRAVRDAYRLGGMPASEDVRELAERWRPQRTLACLFLWRSLELGESLRDSLEVR